MSVYKGHIDGNVTFFKGDDVSELVSVFGCVSICDGATFTAPALIGARVVLIFEGATFTPHPDFRGEVFREIADVEYPLFASDTNYISGCRGPFSAAAALKHWDRSDERAVTFTKAIKAHIEMMAAK